MAHEDFEMAIERRLQGALDATETATLQQHLDGCAACRDYEAAARALDERMETMFRQTTTTMDMAAIGERVQAMMQKQRRSLLWGPLVTQLPVLIIIASRIAHDSRHWQLRLAVMLPWLAISFVLFRALWGRAVRGAEAQLATKGGLTFYRARLDTQIRQLRASRWALLVVLPLYASERAVGDPGLRWLAPIVSLLCVGIVLWAQFWRLPRLVRERAELR